MRIRLKAAILALGRPQYELAKYFDGGETRLSRIVRGRAEPTDEDMRRLSELLGVPLAELFPEVERVARRSGRLR